MATPDELRNLEGVEARLLAAKQLLAAGRVAQAQVLLTEAVDQVRLVSSRLMEGEQVTISSENEEAMKRLIELFYTRFENP